MKLPPNQTEEEVLEAIEKAVAILAPSFVFGYFDLDDIKQHARLEAIDVLAKESYDSSRPLANFLYSHIRNRLINLRRNKYKRNDPPCRSCHEGTPCAGSGLCEKYSAWLKRNMDKANLMRPLDLGNISDEREKRTRVPDEVSSTVEIDELVYLVRTRLPVELQATYLQMRAGVAVPKARRRQVEDAVREILRGDIECPTSAGG